MNILIGADPELFVQRNGQYQSAFNLVPGTKEYPHPVRNGAVQVDGMALEFNIDPADTEDGFIFNITSVMAQLKELVPDYDIVADPVATFTEEYLRTQPAAALELGCDPDFNAWTGLVNDKPVASRPMRTAAGHVHIGWTQGAEGAEHLDNCRKLVRQLDFYLGLPSMLYDNDTERRELYGKAGAYRPKSYGCEYRVLSNRWLKNDQLMRWVYKNTTLAMQGIAKQEFAEYYGDIQKVINNSDVKQAREIIADAGIPVPEGV